VAETNFNSDAFRMGVALETTPSLVRDGSGFRPRKTVLGNAAPSIGEAAPMGVTVAEAFTQDVQ
jgi:hypothetical protein